MDQPGTHSYDSGEYHGEFSSSVLVSVHNDSLAQVSLADPSGHRSFAARSIDEVELELTGPVFFPKGTRVDLELSPTNGSGVHRVTGTVQRVTMTGPGPQYSLWVEADLPGILRRVRIDVDSSAERHSHSPDPPILAANMPSWASQLVVSGSLSPVKLERLASQAKEEQRSVEDVMLDSGAVPRDTIAIAKALEFAIPFVDPRAYRVAEVNGQLLPEELLRRYRLFPLFHIGETVTLGMEDPSDLAAIDQVRLRANCQVDACLCEWTMLDSLIERTYLAPTGQSGDPSATSPAGAEALENESVESNTIVRLVNSIVTESARDGASDIHIEPERDMTRIRIRVDGILHEKSVYPFDLHAPIVSRIKVQAKLDIAETRRPQDGHFAIRLGKQSVDVRVSTIPTVYGENLVLRLMLSDEKTTQLQELGLDPAALKRMHEFLGSTNGMVLVTGPTGSGKTTTLYAALAELNTIERNVVTVEDPVEKRVPLMRQTQVNAKAGVSFATGLRSILRQDPDVIMVGEIRDQETADIAIQAALTGHMVLSTLHTNTAVGAMVRLSEMGVPPFMITSSLRAVVAQRLARRICDSCRQEVTPDPYLLKSLGFGDTRGVHFIAGGGCARCLQTGYKGRVGLYEMLQLTEELSRALLEGASRDKIERCAGNALITTLMDDGLQKVRDGVTTLEEIARVVGVPHPGQGQGQGQRRGDAA